jgi:hypothetical protein
MHPIFGADIVIEKGKRPRSTFAVFERAEAIGGKAKRDISRVREVIIWCFLTVDNDSLPKKISEVGAVENIRGTTRYMLMLICTVTHLFHILCVRAHPN